MVHRATTLVLIAIVALAGAVSAQDATSTVADPRLDPASVADTTTRDPSAPPTQAPVPFCCAEKHFALAGAEVLILELIPWYFNRHVADDSTAILSFDSFGDNIEQGFEWDGNDFRTNMFMHPYHGGVYFNAGRSNGYDFWESVAFAWAGSFIWEMFGENNRGAINDWIATSMGGTTLGEAFHRTGRALRDNTATGAGRGAREMGALFVDPVGTLNRLFRGEMTRVGPNPEDRYPGTTRTTLRVGARTLAGGDTDDNEVAAFFDADVFYGDPFEEHERPFDSFEISVQINRKDSQGLGRLQAEGLLFATSLGESETSRHLFAVNQHYDYVNNEAYEVGGQSLSATFHSRFELSDTWTLRTKIQPTISLIWAVSSDHAEDTGRTYDFGSGAGLRTRFYFNRNGFDLVELFYIGNWSHTLNGAPGDHVVHFLGARARVPIYKATGIGADYVFAARNSYYRDFLDVHRNGGQARLYASFF